MLVLLDNSSGSGDPALLFRSPREVVRASTPEEVGPALARLDEAVAGGLHAAGYLSYELGYALEPRLAPRLPASRPLPLLELGLYETAEPLAEPDVLALLGNGRARLRDIVPDWSLADYQARFAEVHEKIHAGDIYQLNLTFPLRFRLEGEPRALYRELRQRQPVAYGALIETPGASLLSLSPEQFFTLADGRLTSRPMKGTAPRGSDEASDRAQALELARDEKQRAENLMIVDLMRNDLGRIAEPGSVMVSDLFTVETYRTLHQLTSGVEARLARGTRLADLVRAIFPPGSVTGAPKIRAMELIADLESGPRGVYCGAIGHFSPGPRARFNVAIRTPVVLADGRGSMGVGSGVVADSDGTAEYAECLLKMSFLAPGATPPAAAEDFQLIETLLHEPDSGYWLLERHLARLAGSARQLGFSCSEAEVRRALAKAARTDERLRVRLLLARDGEVTVTAAMLAPPAAGAVMTFRLAASRLDSGDPLLRHKTTRRDLYEREWQAAQAAGADEVIFLNERGELAEGSRTNIFIERGGKLLTPALACGVLPGVLRAELLASGRAVEAVLYPADLEDAAALHLGNSVRGLLPARLMA